MDLSNLKYYKELEWKLVEEELMEANAKQYIRKLIDREKPIILLDQCVEDNDRTRS